MAAEFGFEAGGEFYVFPVSFRWPDSILVAELTGLDWQDFLERVQVLFSGDDSPVDYPALTGLIAVAVWRKNPDWERRRVLRFVGALEIDDFNLVVPDPGGDVGPPESKAGSTVLSTPAEKSGSGSASTSEPSTPPSSGTPTSPTSLVEQSA